MNTYLKGKKSEDLAIDFLKAKDYLIIDQNYHASNIGELDIVAEKDGSIVFFEVKSIKFSTQYSIFQTVTKKKALKLKKAIGYWLLKHDKIDCTWQIDFLGIVYNKDGNYEIDHFPFLDID